MNTCEEEKDGRMLLHITSFVDPENPLQHQRLFEQDLIMTAGMGGPLIEQSGENLDEIYDVLDLACGPGGWVLDVARAYPEMMVQGIDSSPFMIRYAQGSAARQGLTNVRFQVMDVTRSFAFPDASFDLINAHLISSLLYPDQWPFLLVECMRLLRPGGIIRLTEGEWGLVTRCAPTVARLFSLFLDTLHRAGRSFRPDDWITPLLLHFLREAGFEEVQCKGTAIDHSFGTPAHPGFVAHYQLLFQLGQSFMLRQHQGLQQEWEGLYQQALAEMRAEHFGALLYLLTAWGKKAA